MANRLKNISHNWLLCAILLFAGVFACFLCLPPGKKEFEAMQRLPGYSFVYRGATNQISGARSARRFTKQHPMMPYLEVVAYEFEKCNWPKEHPVKITETETQVIITWPSMPEILGLKHAWGAGYRKQVIIDKKTRKIISNLVG